MAKRLTIGAILLVVAVGVGLTVVPLPVNVPLLGMIFGQERSFAEDAKLQSRIKLPPGYRINTFAVGLGKARVLALTPDGDILVSDRNGSIRLVKADSNGDGRTDGTSVLADGLGQTHGLWLDGDRLYVGLEGRVVRYAYDADEDSLSNRETVLDGLPDDGGHTTRTVAGGPDGWVYVTIGSSCNSCVEKHDWRSAMVRFRPGENNAELFATGLRNTVGFDWRPETGALYGVDNGRDWLGDDLPPDELNLIEQGKFYGWPYFHGDNLPDPDLGASAKAPAGDAVVPVHAFQAHVAPLSIRFLRQQQGTPLEGAALVTQHGSWNRSEKIGYRVVSLHWDEDGRITQKPFVEGFEKAGDVIGEPVDTAEAPDGTIFISDDYTGSIYRVTRTSAE